MIFETVDYKIKLYIYDLDVQLYKFKLIEIKTIYQVALTPRNKSIIAKYVTLK